MTETEARIAHSKAAQDHQKSAIILQQAQERYQQTAQALDEATAQLMQSLEVDE